MISHIIDTSIPRIVYNYGHILCKICVYVHEHS